MKKDLCSRHQKPMSWRGVGFSPRRWLALWLCLGGVAAGLAQEQHIAYVVPTNTVGNQAFGGSLGMDFDVLNQILVTRLGVFDDKSDGLKLTITARLFDRSTSPPTELANLEFSPDDAGELIGGSRFKNLATPLRLEPGFQGTLVAEGYGAEEKLRNSLDIPANITYTTDDGNGSLQFVGTGRWGNAGEYPATADKGPAARYAAGTFAFQTTPPVIPGRPSGLAVTVGDGQIQLRWQAVTTPLPAAKYQIFRALTPEGASNQLAEATANEYLDKGLVNGQIYTYYVRSVGANGQRSDFSARLCAAPYTLETNLVVAYGVPPGLAGNQAFDGVLGMDFAVLNPIVVTKLGVFDDGNDGLKRTITARLFDRTDPNNPVPIASLEFSPDAPGTLVGGSHFKDLAQPLRLEAGFQGTIATENYGAEERLLNSEGNTNLIVWSLNDGAGSLQFVGTSRYGTTPGAFPDVADAGPAARYAAGSFIFQTMPSQFPGVTTLSGALADRAVQLTWTPVEKPLPAVSYRVYRITADGQTNQVAELSATRFTQANLTKGESVTYVVRAVAASGKEGLDSNPISLMVEAREPGVAYQVEANTLGNQAFGGNLGMDFDAASPIKITRLGGFDDGSDGLALTITVRLYDRATMRELARLDFAPDNFGELIGGSRFKNLTNALVLPAGFQGTIAAAGYGEGERLGNNVAGRTVFSAAGAIRFVGTGRYSVDPNTFPDGVDAGPFNRYAAGTFYFEPLADPPKLASRLEGGKLTLTWTGTGALEKASRVTGPWSAVPGAASGLQVPPTETSAFYRVRM